MMRNFTDRKGIIGFVFLIFLLADKSFAQNRWHPLVLQDRNSGQPIYGATVESTNSNFSRTTDSAGRVMIPSFIFENGERLQISMIGYKKLIIAAKKAANHHTIGLEPDIATLQEVVVTNSAPAARVRDTRMGVDVITSIEAKKLPAILGEVDIVKLLQLKPGVKSAGEGLAGFYVRGGGADQNLILIDKVPVYNPNHLLGLFSVFNNDAIKDVKLYKAAYPAEYSGRLSSVLDVSTRSGSMDSFAVSGGIGLLSSRLSVESPLKKGKSSFIIGGRRTYFDIFTRALNKAHKGDPDYDIIPDYYFSDINFRSDWKINSNNTIWATGYWGADNFSSVNHDYTAQFNWSNRTASLNWRSLLKGKTEITSTLFYSAYEYELGNRSGFNNLVLRSGINTIGMKLTAGGDASPALHWKAGIDGMLHQLNIGDFKSSSDLGGFNAGEEASGNEWGMFMNAAWDKGERLALAGGIRFSGFYSGNRWYVHPEPRLAARYSIGENGALKASYTRMYQYLHLASLSSASLPTDIWYPSTDKTKPQYADQLSVGWSQAVLHDIFYFSLEGYYKWMNNQVELRDGANLFGNPKLENDFVFGKGNAYGVEAYLEKKAGKTTGWLGYTLSWTTRTFPDISGGKSFKPRYDRRHDISLVVMHRFNKKFTVSANWIFGSGAYITVPVGRYVFQDQVGRQPRTITPVYAERGNYQLPAVHRLDLSLVMALKSKRGSSDLTFSLYNAYSRRNPLYIQFQELNNKDGYVTAIEPSIVSLFPLLPGITYNFKF